MSHDQQRHGEGDNSQFDKFSLSEDKTAVLPSHFGNTLGVDIGHDVFDTESDGQLLVISAEKIIAAMKLYIATNSQENWQAVADEISRLLANIKAEITQSTVFDLQQIYSDDLVVLEKEISFLIGKKGVFGKILTDLRNEMIEVLSPDQEALKHYRVNMEIIQKQMNLVEEQANFVGQIIEYDVLLSTNTTEMTDEEYFDHMNILRQRLADIIELIEKKATQIGENILGELYASEPIYIEEVRPFIIMLVNRLQLFADSLESFENSVEQLFENDQQIKSWYQQVLIQTKNVITDLQQEMR